MIVIHQSQAECNRALRLAALRLFGLEFQLQPGGVGALGLQLGRCPVQFILGFGEALLGVSFCGVRLLEVAFDLIGSGSLRISLILETCWIFPIAERQSGARLNKMIAPPV